MVIFFRSMLLTFGFGQASQVILSSSPAIGNVKYVLPTERTFLLNVPEAYAHGEPHPLVLSFHGGKPASRQLICEDELSFKSFLYF